MKGRFGKNSRNGKTIHSERICSYYYTATNIWSAILMLVVGAYFNWTERDLSAVLSSYFCAIQIFMISVVPLFLSDITKKKTYEL